MPLVRSKTVPAVAPARSEAMKAAALPTSAPVIGTRRNKELPFRSASTSVDHDVYVLEQHANRLFAIRGIGLDVSWPIPCHRLAVGDSVRDDTGDLLGGVETRGETVLGQRERGSGSGVGVGVATTDAPYTEHARSLS